MLFVRLFKVLLAEKFPWLKLYKYGAVPPTTLATVIDPFPPPQLSSTIFVSIAVIPGFTVIETGEELAEQPKLLEILTVYSPLCSIGIFPQVLIGVPFKNH